MNEVLLALAGQIEPAEVESYLHAAAWVEERRLEEVSLWQRELRGLLVPLDRDLLDYRLRILDLVRTLAQAEQRDPEEVARDIIEATRDRIDLRFGARVDVDGPSLPDVAAASSAATALLKSAAASSLDTPFRLEPSASEVLDVFASTVRYRVLDRPDFAMRLVLPLQTDFGSARPGHARAMLAAFESVEATRASLDNQLTRVVEYSGLSQPLVDSLLDLLHVAEGRLAFEFRFADPGEPPSTFEILFSDADELPLLELATTLSLEEPELAIPKAVGPAELPSPAELDRLELVGEVTRLSRPEISVRGLVFDRLRRVRATVTEDQYLEAIDAHANGFDVAVTGPAEIYPRSARFTWVETFEVLR